MFRSLTLADLPTGTEVRVTSYGYGARQIDCGRTGTVTGHARKRATVQLRRGNGLPAEVRNIDPACLRRTTPSKPLV